MTLDVFIKEINGELSQDCQLPFQIPKKSLMRTISNAKKWFYKNYIYAVEECYMYIPRDTAVNQTPSSSIKLPSDVMSVNEVHKTNYNSGLMSGDFAFDKLSARAMFNEGQAAGAGNFDLYVSNRVTLDWIKSITFHEVSYTYNHLTHNFRIMGENPRTSLVLNTHRTIDDAYLFDDEMFFRYVVAEAKVNLGRILGTISMQYIGNAEIDFGGIKSEGQEDKTNLIEEILGLNSADWFGVQ